MAGVWSSPEILRAVRDGDNGAVIRLVRQKQGMTQTALGAACGYSQSVISRIERGHSHSYDIRFLRSIAVALGVPPQLLGVAEQTESEVNRRDFLAAGGALAASSLLPTWPVAEVGPDSYRHITAGHRRLDAFTPSRDLADAVRAHLRLTHAAFTTAPDKGTERALAAAMSEVAGFAGWLHWDMYDLGSARRYYGMAIATARQTGNAVLSAYMVGSLAAFAAQLGDAHESVRLVATARQQLGADCPAIADAWLSSVAALAHASARDERTALAALDHATAAVARMPAEDAPPWPWVFGFDTGKVAAHRLACAVRLHRHEMAIEAVKEAGSTLTASTKQAALWQLDHAGALVGAGDVERAFSIATRVLDVAEQQRSARIVERARELRRTFENETAASPVRDFDERLSTLAV